ncbi:hypothetical protein [Streptomyces spectabilis]|uniref:Uncharacterized protein n=1 Tax=Streptomyces spectabilis TaxID=68270 RepID=A0A516R1Q8_STRST|nr:hypothetical protein [Streptomyces spectabilis]QDQ09593.1 hypothetical protein FH965_02650 [Streptomyces spectabilis]
MTSTTPRTAPPAASARLSDDFPVLLGPVRVETRFTQAELLVRIFPDEWALDRFEPRPTRSEITALDAYWTARWAAGGRDAGVRAAWQELVQRVSAGRASWLLGTRPPANPADEPTGAPAGRTILVVVTPQPVAATDRQPTVAYWTSVWRAHGDRRLLRQADATLLTAVGAGRANAIRSRRASGTDAAPVSTSDDVSVAFLVLPPVAAADTAPQSWTRAALARLLPERFQVIGYVGGQQVLAATGAPVPATLPVSPDPGATDQLKVDETTGALHVPEDLRWLTDFDRAVALGMGLRIPLDDRTRGGLDRLVVFGLREQPDAAKSAADLADLISRQVRGPSGYGLVPQGTPTNNTEQAPAGQDATDEADAALRAAAGAPLAGAADWTTRTDGQCFTDLLGLDPAVLTGMPNADGTDQRDARAANTALWPMTWGAFLQSALHPVLDRGAVGRTRDFFLRYVSGRGPLPSFKIGRQPYGIVATTAFSRLAWPDAAPFLRGLNRVLGTVAQDWQLASAKVARLGAATDDAHQLLLDVLALHPTSTEYHQRYALSVEDIFNRENLGGLGSTVLPALDRLNMPGPLRTLLARLGYEGGTRARDPELLRRLFTDAQQPLLAPLIDARPLSETDPLPPCTDDRRSYLRWLADAAGTDLDTIRLESGFADDSPPAALLYLLLRHSVLLGWADAARDLAVAAGTASATEAATDSPFVHIRIPAPGQSLPSESRFRRLYAPDPAVTGSPEQLLVDFIPGVLGRSPATAELAEQTRALSLLADLPTARLERVLAEHLDLATYRLDAWRLGLATARLAELRFGADGSGPPRRGVHLGAYGWLEDVRPSSDQLTPVQLTGPLAQVFGGGAPLLHNPANAGFVHAPSPGHARTAAVLRAGYVANSAPDSPHTFAVDLSSERVRVALGLLDGLRQGQSLGALLGYRLERGLHDRHDEAEVDRFIAALRGRFPLRAGRIPQTVAVPSDSSQPVAIEQVEARNVVDGLALVRHVTRTDVPDTYPFGLADALPAATPAQSAVLTAEVRRLLDIHDALADLAVAESTHQALSGNTERASATLDAYAKAGFPPEPTVVGTPRSGTTLTHRFGLRLTPGLRPGHGATPRAQAEPAVDDWLEGLLPDAGDVVALVAWTDPVNGRARSKSVSLDDVGFAPIDLLWALRTTGTEAMTDLEDRIVGVVVDREGPRPDAELTIRHTQRVEGQVTFFELSPLIGALRTLLTTSRPLRTSDLVPAARTTPVDRAVDDAVALPRERPEAVLASLTELRDDVDDYLHDLSPLYPAPPAPPRRPEVLGAIDAFLSRYADLVSAASGFGMTRSGWGELAQWRRLLYADVLTAVAAVAARMTRALADADALIARYDALPAATPDSERFRLLQQAQRLLTTQPAGPRPNRPAQLRATVGNRRREFSTRLQGLDQQARTTRATLSGLLSEVSDRLPLTDIDPAGLDLTPFQDRVVAFGKELLDRARALRKDISDRISAADGALAEHARAVTGPDRVEAGLDALKALLGPDVLAVPEFTPPPAIAAELRKARGDGDKLLRHLTQPPLSRDFPVDDWLHGIARVREMPRLWEQAVVLADALRDNGALRATPGSGPRTVDAGPELEPVQLPYRPGDHWLGMEFAADTTITEDKLLFTAHYANSSRTGDDEAHCGLLFDEWTEVIPAERETTAIAADIDRPDSEPPQAMLLVAPPVRTGTWNTDDLVAAIHETFDLARSRAVEPAHLDGTAYAHLLPATLMSATAQPITISTDLATANARWKADHD